MTSDFEGFLYQILSITLFSYLNSWERASIFPFECSVLNKDTSGTIFITSLVWRGPWLGIEPGTSRTRSQHYTTRLSRRWRIYCKTYRATIFSHFLGIFSPWGICNNSSIKCSREVKGRVISLSITMTTDNTATITSKFHNFVGHMPFLMEFLNTKDKSKLKGACQRALSTSVFNIT